VRIHRPRVSSRASSLAVDDAGVRALAAALLGGSVSDRLVDELDAACDGSAARAREILNVSLAVGSLIETDGKWDVAGDLVSDVSTTWPLPGLGVGAVSAAELVAVAGSISVATLEGLVDQRSIDELDARRVVVVDEASRRLRIASPLVRAAIASNLAPLRRERIRARLASADVAQD